MPVHHQIAMNHQAPRSEEKVDALLVPTDDKKILLAIYNVNVPFNLFLTQEDTIQVLERVKNLLVRDFSNVEATFQLTASYLLVHKTTGQFRTWSGSFYPRGNSRSYLSGFRRFNPDTFVQFGLDSLENVEFTLLNWPNRRDTSWVLHEVISIIFNVQSLVSNENPLIRKFPGINYGRKKRITFALP